MGSYDYSIEKGDKTVSVSYHDSTFYESGKYLHGAAILFHNEIAIGAMNIKLKFKRFKSRACESNKLNRKTNRMLKTLNIPILIDIKDYSNDDEIAQKHIEFLRKWENKIHCLSFKTESINDYVNWYKQNGNWLAKDELSKTLKYFVFFKKK